MAVLIVLVTSWLGFRALGAAGVPTLGAWSSSGQYALAAMFVFTALAHFTKMKHELARMVLGISTSAAGGLHNRHAGICWGCGLIASEISGSGRFLPDCVPGRNVSSKRESGAGSAYAARETDNHTLAARTHAGAFDPPSLVVRAEYTPTANM
jgi:hypothetical protein